MTALRFQWARWTLAIIVAIGGAAGAIAWLNVRGEQPVADAVETAAPSTELVQRGAYLARAGNCAACHTDRGGAAFAGGKALATPFGSVYAGNITPDLETGIGRWSSDHFWRALHHGRARDGRLLYPAFPYTEYTNISRADSDALYSYLRSVPAVKQANRPHDLRFPYNLQASLAIWRALFFSPGGTRQDPTKSAEWNRGAYLVRGLGHCEACHAPRNAFGATQDTLELSGGLIPMQNWYAPSLASPSEAGVQDWSGPAVVALMKNGIGDRGATLGPMAEVVYGSTQYLSDTDLQAMATFLRDLPRREAERQGAAPVASDVRDLGARLYKAQCAECHGDRGEGAGSIYPALAGHRTVTMDSSANLVKVILNGGFPPTTVGNPRPFGMPPVGQNLSDAEIAALASYVRGAWGNKAAGVSAFDVSRVR